MPRSQDASSSSALRAAYAHLSRIHHLPCTNDTKMLFKRLPTYGVSNDLNSLVRAFAAAIRDERQLVLLPPTASERAKVEPHAGLLDARRPWHWLEAGVPLASLVEPSACQRALLRRHAAALDALGNTTDNMEPRKNLARFGLAGLSGRVRDHAVHVRWRVDYTNQVIPSAFRRHGLLWWFQVLTTFLLRVRGPLAKRLASHPALVGTLGWPAAAPTIDEPTAPSAGTPPPPPPPHAAGWTPPVRFDVGLHMRMGDACGASASIAGNAQRHCVSTLAAALERLRARGVVGGRAFLATDSETIVREAEHPAEGTFRFSYLDWDRRKYDVSERVEETLERRTSAVLEEALLDLLLLARARTVAGSLFGNMPRLALQWRVEPPHNSSYVSVDGYPWCTRTSCGCHPLCSTTVSRIPTSYIVPWYPVLGYHGILPYAPSTTTR